MKKEKITKHELVMENWNFTVNNGGGYIETSPTPLKHSINNRYVSSNDEDNLLLPTGYTLEDEDEKKQHIQRNVMTNEVEPLYPLGVEIEN